MHPRRTRETIRRTHRRLTARRRKIAARTAALALAAAVMSVTLDGHQAPRATSAPAAGPGAGPPVKINRTVPRVSAPPLRPVFSDPPTDDEIRRARVFSEPLLPLGPTAPAENQALAAGVKLYVAGGRALDTEPFQAFLKRYPASAWRGSLLANLRSLYRAGGYYTRALSAWDEAWSLAQDDTSPNGRAIADMAAGSALDMLATLGNLPGLDRWIERTKERAISGPAGSKAARARETRAFIVAHPERTIASGPKALEILLEWRAAGAATPPRDRPAPAPAALKNFRQTAAGTSLLDVRALATTVGLSMKAVRRDPGAPLVVPAVVHLGFEHFSAVLEEVNGRFRVRDPALGGEVWMTREALDEEMTGYALVLGGAAAPGWRDVADSDAAVIVGHSCPPGIPDPDECPCPESEPGMATCSLHPTQASVLLSDSPLGYSPPRGPALSLQLRYNHREENQPQAFAFANLGAKWTMNWVSYAEEVPFTWFDKGGVLQYAQPEHIAVHVPQGGVERFTYPDGTATYPRHYRSGAVLVQVSASPLVYEHRHTDGSREVYGLSDGGVPGTRRVFLTAIVDPHGQTLTFTWDAQLRLVALTDALGQVTTLQYADAADPLKITSVTDPFGRVARFTYDGGGHLETVTDVVDLPSRFVYGTSDFIAALETPYGTTTFRQPWLAGQYKRAIEAMDPLGAVERLEFHWDTAPVPASGRIATSDSGAAQGSGFLSCT